MDLSTVSGFLFAGIYSVLVYLVVVNTFSTKQHLSWFGVRNKWIAFIFLLFTFGYIKHEIGYYTSLDPAYCKQTSECSKQLKSSQENVANRAKAFVGFEENIWLESAGEGVVYILVGIPMFLLVRPQLLAAFATGILAQYLSAYSGINRYFCRKSCKLNPL